MPAGDKATVKVSGGEDYTSLSGAFAGEDIDLSEAGTGSETVGGITYTDVALFIECWPSGGTDATDVTTFNTDTWVTDATHRLLIATKDSEWPTVFGVGGGFYKIASDPTGENVFIWSAELIGVDICGLEVEQTNTGAVTKRPFNYVNTTSAAYGDVTLNALVLKNNSSNAEDALRVQGNSAFVKMYNSYFEAVGGRGFELDRFQWFILNCLAVNCGDDGYFTNTVGDENNRIHNSAAYNNTGAGFDVVLTLSADNNASDDASEPDDSSTSQAIDINDFEDAASEDWTPADPGDLLNNGADLSGTPWFMPAVDALGNARPIGSEWDIGPIERLAAAAGGTTVARGLPQRNRRVSGLRRRIES